VEAPSNPNPAPGPEHEAAQRQRLQAAAAVIPPRSTARGLHGRWRNQNPAVLTFDGTDNSFARCYTSMHLAAACADTDNPDAVAHDWLSIALGVEVQPAVGVNDALAKATIDELRRLIRLLAAAD
jgi:hypothetical protein